jgi:CubicO group peptidase (beta-lactamase class C family)
MKRRDFAIGLGALSLAGAVRSGPAREVDAGVGRTDALLLMQNGRVILERYGPDFGPATPHISWSVAKSITQALVGIAVAEGRIDIDRPLSVVAHPSPGLTLRRLLTLTDGMAWEEGAYTPTDSDATKMLFGPGRFDNAAFIARRGQAYPPGTHWRYSTGAFALAAAELQAHLFPGAHTPEARRGAMADWIKTRLFQPLGMTTALAEFDPAGTFAGGSMVYASARDFARFGELYRLDGVWNGRRILPPGWVTFARTPTLSPIYGSGFWLEAPPSTRPPSLMGGHGPSDAFSCQGHAGQVVLIVPSKALVLVRLGLMDDDDAHWTALGRRIGGLVVATSDVKSV